jgi:hypothetical protein
MLRPILYPTVSRSHSRNGYDKCLPSGDRFRKGSGSNYSNRCPKGFFRDREGRTKAENPDHSAVTW